MDRDNKTIIKFPFFIYMRIRNLIFINSNKQTKKFIWTIIKN